MRLEMPAEADVADGNWHNVVVTREGNVAVLQLDYSGRVSRNTGKEGLISVREECFHFDSVSSCVNKVKSLNILT